MLISVTAAIEAIQKHIANMDADIKSLEEDYQALEKESKALKEKLGVYAAVYGEIHTLEIIPNQES